MGIVETSIMESPTPRKELLRWCDLLGMELNDLIEEAPQLAKYLEEKKDGEKDSK